MNIFKKILYALDFPLGVLLVILGVRSCSAEPAGRLGAIVISLGVLLVINSIVIRESMRRD